MAIAADKLKASSSPLFCLACESQCQTSCDEGCMILASEFVSSQSPDLSD